MYISMINIGNQLCEEVLEFPYYDLRKISFKDKNGNNY